MMLTINVKGAVDMRMDGRWRAMWKHGLRILTMSTLARPKTGSAAATFFRSCGVSRCFFIPQSTTKWHCCRGPPNMHINAIDAPRGTWALAL